MVATGYLTVVDKRTSKLLCNTEIKNVEKDSNSIRSSGNNISIQLNAMNSFQIQLYMTEYL